MKTTVTTLENNRVKLAVEVDVDDLEPAMDRAAQVLSRDVSLKGFRRGKVPRKVLERAVGREAIVQEAVRIAVPEFLAQAVEDEEIDFVGRPEIEDVDGGLDEPLVFQALLDTRPDVDLGDLSEIEVQIETELEPGAEDIQNEVDALRERFASLDTVERPGTDGDFVVVNLDVTVGGESVEALSRPEFHYEVGSGTVVEELDVQLLGKSPGDILQFDATLPDEFPVHAGEGASFKVMVKEVKQKRLPDLDDEFVEMASEFDTVDELETAVTQQLAMQRLAAAYQEAQAKAIEVLAEQTGIDAPQSVVDEEIEMRVHDIEHQLEHRGANLDMYLQTTGSDRETFVAGLREEAESSVRNVFLLGAVAQTADIEVTPEELEAEVRSYAEQTQKNVSKARKELAKSGRLSSLVSGMLRQKALEHLLETVTVVDSAGQKVDLSAQALAEIVERSPGVEGVQDASDDQAGDTGDVPDETAEDEADEAIDAGGE